MSPLVPTKIVEKPWGHELWWAQNDDYVAKVLHIKQGHSLSLQYHQEKRETFMLISGAITIEFFEEGQTPQTIKLGLRTPFHVEPGLRHRMTADADSELVEVSTPQVNDIVRLEDRYGRV